MEPRRVGICAGRGHASPEATLRAAPVRAASAARERPATGTRVPRRRGDATSPPDRPWLPLDGLSPLCTATARRGRNQHLAPLNYFMDREVDKKQSRGKAPKDTRAHRQGQMRLALRQKHLNH